MTTSTPRRRFRISPVAIIAIVVIVVSLVGFVVWRSHHPDQSASAGNTSASATPSATAASESTDPDETDPVPADASASSVDEEKALLERVRPFEEAYIITDVKLRDPALDQYATREFMQKQPKENDTSPAGQANLQLLVHIDWSASRIQTETEEGDPHLIHVVSHLYVTTVNPDGTANDSYYTDHRTSWSDQADKAGVWLAALDEDNPVGGDDES